MRATARAEDAPRAPFAIRLWHLGHGLLFPPLLVTGWHLHYGTVEMWGYARSVQWHEALGLAAAGFAFAAPLGILATGRLHEYVPPRRGLARALAHELERYTIGIWRGAPVLPGGPAGERLNPVQRLLYLPLLLLVLPGLAGTGLVLLAPSFGVAIATEPHTRAMLATTHTVLASLATLFLFLHLYMATMAAWRRILLGLVATLILSGAPAEPAAEIALDRTTPALQCVGCHSGTPGSRRIVTDARTGARKDVTVELARLQQGVHGRMACRECHSRGFDRFPHRAPAERRFPACRDCHPRTEPADAAARDAEHGFRKIEAEHAATLHATSFRKVRGERDCEACHHPHYMRASATLLLPARLLTEHDGPCRACHAPDASGPLSDPVRPDLVSVHGSVPHAARHLEAVRCTDCHASRFRPSPHDLLTGRAAEGCVDCHRRSSALVTGLWRHVPDAGTVRDGFANARLLDAHYVIGATRPVGVDRAVAWSLGLLILAIAAHALFRLTARLRRARGR